MEPVPSDVPRELDVRGLKCPLPVLKARRAMREVPVGGMLTVITSDPQAPDDFVHYCMTTGHEIMSSNMTDGEARITMRRVV